MSRSLLLISAVVLCAICPLARAENRWSERLTNSMQLHEEASEFILLSSKRDWVLKASRKLGMPTAMQAGERARPAKRRQLPSIASRRVEEKLGVVEKRWQDLYEPRVFEGLPFRVMKPFKFDAKRKYPVIVSLHGAGGKGTDNNKQLKDWNRHLAEEQRRKQYPCYVIAPQAAELWNAQHLKKIKSLIKTLDPVDVDRIYVLGHSMGGHGTYIFIQIDATYFAAAAPSAGSGLRTTEEFINPDKIKNVPIWAFHGDRDKVCPIEKDQRVFDAMKRLCGNMKFTVWQGDGHGVSGKMIPGADNGRTYLSSDHCDAQADFMTWLFSQSREQ